MTSKFYWANYQENIQLKVRAFPLGLNSWKLCRSFQDNQGKEVVIQVAK